MHRIYVCVYVCVCVCMHRMFALYIQNKHSPFQGKMDSSKVYLSHSLDPQAQSLSLGSEGTCSQFLGPAVLAG